ncbi:MAG: hypothetical protein U0Q15_03730 [Kineosporiaceae bacterium]
MSRLKSGAGSRETQAMGMRPTRRHRRAHAFASALAVAVVYGGYLAVPSTAAAFLSRTQTPSTSFTTTTIAIGDDDSDTAMFGGVVTSTASVECIAVTYTGGAATGIRLYGSVSGDSGIYPYVTLKIEEGTGGSSSSCSGFSATSTPFNATVNTFAATQYSNGLLTWAPTTTETRTYRVSLSVGAGTPIAQQGSQVTLSFTWEARAGT